MSQPKVTLIGGPTALIEIGGFRLLTDPTFDAPGEYRLPHVTLKKTSSPALTVLQRARIRIAVADARAGGRDDDRAAELTSLQVGDLEHSM